MCFICFSEDENCSEKTDTCSNSSQDAQIGGQESAHFSTNFERSESDTESSEDDQSDSEEEEVSFDPDYKSTIREIPSAKKLMSSDINLLFGSVTQLSTKCERQIVSWFKTNGFCSAEVKIKNFTNAADKYVSYYEEKCFISNEGDVFEDLTYVYCKDISGLMRSMYILEHDPTDWHIFLDGTTESFKVVLLSNGNRYPPIPLLYSTTLSENYLHIDHAMKVVKYHSFKWIVTGDFKMLNILVGLCGGSPSYACYLCTKRFEHTKVRKIVHFDENEPASLRTSYKKPQTKDAPTRMEIQQNFNIKYDAIVDITGDSTLICPPPLHILLGLFTVLFEILHPELKAFIIELFRQGRKKKSIVLANEGTFNGPQIRKVMRSQELQTLLENPLFEKERRAFEAFAKVSKFVLTSHFHSDRKALVDEMFDSYKQLGSTFTLKMHFLKDHLMLIPQDADSLSDQMGEQFHQRLKKLEANFKGKSHIKMLATWCVRASRINLTHKMEL